MIKTSRKQFAALQKTVQSLHSYDVPEIVAVPVVAGSRDYLAWISESLATPKKRSRQ
jgi:periplasmic divalent cation tolerance protein